MSASVQRVDFFRPPKRPNGGTVYVRPSESGNPYARVDEDTSIPRPVVDVQLPPAEDDPVPPPNPR